MRSKVRNGTVRDKDGRERKVLRSIRPNAGVAARYNKRLVDLVKEMSKSVEWWTLAEYKRQYPRLAMDASPTTILRELMNRLARRWERKFNELADDLARGMVQSVGRDVDAGLKRALRDAGFTVKFSMTRAQSNIVQASIAENVELIRSIPERYFTNIKGDVMRAVNSGWRTDRLYEELKKYEGVTERRASIIARDQTRKATANYQRTRQLELGITEGMWIHSGGGREPRQSHKDFNRKIFKLSEGHDFGDGFGKVIPGQAINCRCVYAAVI